MSDATAEYFEAEDKRARLNRLTASARKIRNDFHLKTVLLRFDVHDRRNMYDLLKPHLQFAPLSYARLMRLSGLARRIQ
jgi:hypothetical protein